MGGARVLLLLLFLLHIIRNVIFGPFLGPCLLSLLFAWVVGNNRQILIEKEAPLAHTYTHTHTHARKES